MIKRYVLSQLTNVSAWIGIAVILSTMLLPHSVNIFLGAFLILTPDNKLNDLVRDWLPAVKKILEGK